jgi:hypothetical protein
MNQAADNNPMVASAIAAGVGIGVSTRVVGPLYDKAKGAVAGMLGRKAANKVSAEVKNAMSLGDVLGVVAGAIGKLK